jgi:D-3-phosphoglycerate dehydrogenase
VRKFKLLITAHSFGSCGDEVFEKMKKYDIDYIHIRRTELFKEEDLINVIKEFDGIIVGADILSKKVIENADNLKIIAKHGVGLDNIDLISAKSKNIIVTIADKSNNVAVAEHSIALMMSLAKNIETNSLNVKAGKWERLIGRELTGQTLGVLGTGSIGKEVIKLMGGFGMKILGYDIFRDESFMSKYAGEYIDMDTLLSSSDYVTLHLPLLPETKKIINTEKMQLMKTTAYLINTARGGLIDEEDLYEALVNGTIAGAGIDTFENEPPINSKLLNLPNVVISPHTASYTYEAINKMSNYALDSIIDFVVKRDVRNKIIM